jgi:rSAM/selenodomain-associated transferase 2
MDYEASLRTECESLYRGICLRAPASTAGSPEEGSRMVISVIIPVYNEEKALPRTLEGLMRQTGDYEIVVVDAGSTDATATVLAGYPQIRVLQAPRGRASQMNAGAAAARGEWLLFLHADTLLPAGALARLHAWERDHDIQAGGFRHRFSGDRWSLRVVSWLDNLRCRMTGIIFGDQALFVRRGLFERLGGFPEDCLMEDVVFGERLVRQTRPLLATDSIITDARKFEQMGVWRSLLRVVLILVCHELRLSK